MQQNLEILYKRALANREPWLNRWDSARRYAMPSTDDDVATLYDATASDAADNLAASIYTLLTPPESLWVSLVGESEKSPNADIATSVFGHVEQNTVNRLKSSISGLYRNRV